MALGNEDYSSRRNNAPVEDVMDIESHSQLIFETPPPEVVDSINECFEQFTRTLEQSDAAAGHRSPSDSFSGESLFITQSRAKAARIKRQLGSSETPDSIGDSGSGRENEEQAKGKMRRKYIKSLPQRLSFPFLLKSSNKHCISLKKHRVLENSEIGGFLKCIWKIKDCCVNTGKTISESLLESDLSDDSEGDEHNSDHEVTKVDRTIFVPSYFKGNQHKWLPQSFLEMRAQCSLSDDEEERLFSTKVKEKKRKNKSAMKKKASASKNKPARKSRAAARTLSESSVDSLFMEQEKQNKTHEVLAACSDAEHSDSAHHRRRLTEQTVQCLENLDGDHLVVIEETQRNSIEALTEAAVHMEHDGNASLSSQADDFAESEKTVSDLQSENTAERVEEINSPVLSDSLFTSKQKNEKRHELNTQEVESGADSRGADSAHSVEMDRFSESQTTEMTLKRTKKKRKDKERTKTEDNSRTEILSNETCEAPETEQPEHRGTSEEISGLKSVKKKNVIEESPYDSDFALDVNSVSQFDNVTDRSTTHETAEERPSDVLEHTQAEINDAAHSDSVQCAGNLHGDHLSVIEDRQTNSVEAVTEQAMQHEDDLTPGNNLLNKSSSLLLPQEGDISIQNDIQQTDSDFGSQDLFISLNSPKAAPTTVNMEESDQDSDVTQIETEVEFESIFGPGTPRWCDGGCRAYEDNYSDGKSVSVFGSGTPNKQLTSQDMNSTQHPESQKKAQTPVGLNKKRKNGSRSHKDSDVTDVEETVNVQPSSGHLPLAGQPLKEVCSILSERLNMRKRREMETDPQEIPLFKNDGLSFIKRKRKLKEKLGATNFIQCDLNVDVGSESPADDITGVKTTPRENKKSNEVENRVTNKEQREETFLHIVETSLNLEESVADDSAIPRVKRKKKKKYKLKEHDVEPSVEIQSVETVQFSGSQTAELTSKITKKKRKVKDRTKIVYVGDSDRPAELRVNDQHSEVPETNEPEFIQTSEEITGCPVTNVTTLKPVKKKKKKKKRDETEEHEYEPVDLDVSSRSRFDHAIEERPIDCNTAEHLEGIAPLILKAARIKKKGRNASSLSDIIGLENQASGSQSESAEVVLKKKTKKKQELQEQKNAELASDIGEDVRLFQQSESSITDSLTRKTKKKRANKDRERTTDSSSNGTFDQMYERLSEVRENNVIQSIEANKTNLFEHLQMTEDISCSSPSVNKWKKKKKKDRSEKPQYDSASQLDVVSGLMGQKMIERPSTDSAVEHLEGNSVDTLKVAKRKKKSQISSSSAQADGIVGLENAVSDLQSENTAERVEEMNSPVLSDSLFTSKQKKKKRHKLKVQEEVESGADSHRADSAHSVEMDRFSESQTTEMTLKRTKKKRKDKERTKTEDNSRTEILSNETCEALETEQPEHIQTSEEISGLKSVKKKKKKKKKKNASEESQYDFALDVNSVSQVHNVTDRSTTQETAEERLSDVLEHTQAEINDPKHKKKRKRSSLSVNNGSEFSSSDAQMQESVVPERKRKKKRNSDHVTNAGELILESSDHTALFEKSQSPVLKSLESITKKSKKRKNKEIIESINHVPENSAQAETIQTTRTDSIIQHNADRQAHVIISLGDSEDIRKKKKKRKKKTENITVL
ncbi:phoenix [Puntigrus tetrazona]|uniref:phoenix n=1 Tax=Puntigrus tetrazona TaxID=1606681 RepID=UPI001C894D3C|nr:phoenix [Puntigrus tetrazona]